MWVSELFSAKTAEPYVRLPFEIGEYGRWRMIAARGNRSLTVAARSLVREVSATFGTNFMTQQVRLREKGVQPLIFAPRSYWNNHKFRRATRNGPGLETVVLVRRSMSLPVAIRSVAGVSGLSREIRITTLIIKGIQKYKIT